MEDRFSLKGKFFLIAGGTRGIGRAISLRFARAGAAVLAVYVRDSASAESLRSSAAAEGGSIEICRADLTSQKGKERLQECLERYDSPLSGLVYCAATGVHRPLEELNLRFWDWTFSLNVRGFFELVQWLLPRFSEGASIVALSSQGAIQAMPYYSLVGASKGALESFCRHLAVEVAPRGIRVNILSPGSVLTEAWANMPDKEKRLEETAARTPLERLITLEEVAWVAHFLCSEASSGIVGHTLVVDGGTRIVG